MAAVTALPPQKELAVANEPALLRLARRLRGSGTSEAALWQCVSLMGQSGWPSDSRCEYTVGAIWGLTHCSMRGLVSRAAGQGLTVPTKPVRGQGAEAKGSRGATFGGRRACFRGSPLTSGAVILVPLHLRRGRRRLAPVSFLRDSRDLGRASEATTPAGPSLGC